ncbi:hypothetical protein DFA_06015 [Cavenderia fasciculata]|uniref:Nudix hydrolase domain-containing protein n=1 Tax=Cavenderia fasciculata TaxID=261658 RepID=F4PJV3_CACFS|nr:uncharacterized protein DFA_06015 [Cavenderia fasciculata]EGG23877.1 hypothetical protein DFA_06015 [Cavenderia fasciculata]|eukprot:XP_004361728.1 hypothetical protein DFA_06015 [Cavenderia fasciculata]
MNISNLIPSLLGFNYRRITASKLAEAKRRASVAVVLRLASHHDGDSTSTTTTTTATATTTTKPLKVLTGFNCRCLTTDNKHSESCLRNFITSRNNITSGTTTTVEALYAKKSRGRRKGEIAFAGGHIEKGETEEQAAEREALEEVGLDLADGKQFSFIGRLNDRVTFDHIAIYTFVYLQLTEKTPPITFSDDEMEDCGWVDLDYFTKRQGGDNNNNNNNNNNKLKPANRIVDSTLFNTDVVEFQSLASMSSRRLTNPFLKQIFNSFRVPLVQLPIKTSEFRLWGLTLELTSELIKVVNGSSPIPSIQESNSRLAFFCINNPLLAIGTLTLLFGLVIPGILFYYVTNKS